jgi:hypothetical protein
MAKENKKFNYVIARKWFDNSNSLSCYSYGQTVFYGDMDDAKQTLYIIKERAGDEANEYQIYKVKNKPV